MTRSGSRGRALLFALAAGLCALGSAAFASRYSGTPARETGGLREVLVSSVELSAGQRLTSRRAARTLEVRQMPARYVPPDALDSVAEAVGARPHAQIPAGSYLLASQLAEGATAAPTGPGLPRGLQPIEITVSGAGALAEALSPGSSARPLVDVIAADEPGSTVNPRVRVLARMVPLLGLQSRPQVAGEGGAEWLATLAVSRSEALKVIEAENFARDVRLLPRGSGR